MLVACKARLQICV